MPKLTIKGGLTYGGRSINFDVSIDIKPLTILIGPNLSGKSLTLMCLAKLVRRKVIARGYVIDRIDELPQSLECAGDDLNYDYAVYVDAYRVMLQPFIRIRSILNEIIRTVKDLRDENLLPIKSSILRDADVVIKSLSEDEIAEDLHAKASMRFLHYAMNLFEKVRNDFQSIIEEASKSFGEHVEDFRRALSHFMPLFIEYVKLTDNTAWYWYDLELGNTGFNIEELSSVYAPSLVAFYALHAYALPQNSVLLIEEPEAHAHPSLSLFLGYFLNKLVQDSEQRLKSSEKPWIFHIVAATQSMDFLRGALMAGEDTVGVYVFDRDVAEGRITVKPWSGGAVIPGFTEPTLLTILGGKR